MSERIICCGKAMVFVVVKTIYGAEEYICHICKRRVEIKQLSPPSVSKKTNIATEAGDEQFPGHA
jgi:hypothetical protein